MIHHDIPTLFRSVEKVGYPRELPAVNVNDLIGNDENIHFGLPISYSFYTKKNIKLQHHETTSNAHNIFFFTIINESDTEQEVSPSFSTCMP